MESESLHQQLDPTPYRTLQPQAAQIHNGSSHLGAHHALASQAALDLSALEDGSSVFHQNLQLQSGPSDHPHAHNHAHAYSSPHTFDRNHAHRPIHVQSNGSPHTPQQHGGHGGQFGILTSNSMQHNSINRLQQEEDIFGPTDGAAGGSGSGGGEQQKGGSHLTTKIVIDPPNLEEWRQKLFDVNEMITLSEEEYVFQSNQGMGGC
jgi:hypothetical protein